MERGARGVAQRTQRFDGSFVMTKTLANPVARPARAGENPGPLAAVAYLDTLGAFSVCSAALCVLCAYSSNLGEKEQCAAS